MLYEYIICCVYFLFFFKQKTAYEMRISDWSSDVCSSDLQQHDRGAQLLLVELLALLLGGEQRAQQVVARVGSPLLEDAVEVVDDLHEGHEAPLHGGVVDVAVDHARGVGAPGAEQVAVLRGRSEERRVGTECVSTVRTR